MNEVERGKKLFRDIKIRNTHTYWAILIISKKDDPSDREIKLESHAYTLPDIKYKNCEKYKKLVAKEFNQKMREKYDPDIYQDFPILWDKLYLKQEEAEKRMEQMNKTDDAVSRISRKKD